MGISTPAVGTFVKHVGALKSPRQSDVASVALPTVEPETSQIIYTVLESDIPTYEPPLFGFTNVAIVFAGVVNASGANRSIGYRMKKNGSSVSTGSGTLSNGNKGTFAARFTSVQVGDVIELSVWDGSGLTTLVARGLQIAPSRNCPVPDKTIRNMRIKHGTHPTFDGATGYSPSYGTGYFALRINGQDTTHSSASADIVHSAWYSNATDFIYRIYYGDFVNSNAVVLYQSSGNHIPYIFGNKWASEISYEVILDNRGE